MDDEKARERFASARVARFATVRPNGFPHLVPSVYVLDGEAVYSFVDAKPKRSRDLIRLANIRANPRVSLLVDHYEEKWDKLWWIRVDGEARVVEDGPDRRRAVELLMGKYPQYEDWVARFGAAVLVEITGWTYWSYS